MLLADTLRHTRVTLALAFQECRNKEGTLPVILVLREANCLEQLRLAEDFIRRK